jgi:hypothetical protein
MRGSSSCTRAAGTTALSSAEACSLPFRAAKMRRLLEALLAATGPRAGAGAGATLELLLPLTPPATLQGTRAAAAFCCLLAERCCWSSPSGPSSSLSTCSSSSSSSSSPSELEPSGFSCASQAHSASACSALAKAALPLSSAGRPSSSAPPQLPSSRAPRATMSRGWAPLRGTGTSSRVLAAKTSLGLCSRATKRAAKSPALLQEHSSPVGVTLSTEQPELLQAAEPASQRRHWGTGRALGQEKLTVVPPVPGPHRKLRGPQGAPQSALRR